MDERLRFVARLLGGEKMAPLSGEFDISRKTGYKSNPHASAHQHSRWTGHVSRLDRNLNSRFGSAAYAAEELIAELSSAMIGAQLGLPVSHLDSHASYIGHWLKQLRSDDRAILTAAARAEEASAMLLQRGCRTAVTQADRANDLADAA